MGRCTDGETRQGDTNAAGDGGADAARFLASTDGWKMSAYAAEDILDLNHAIAEIAKFGDRRCVSVDSGVCDEASIGSCALAICAATSASRAGEARVVAENGVGERRASHQLSGAGHVAEASLP